VDAGLRQHDDVGDVRVSIVRAPGITQLVNQGILVDLLEKSDPERIHNAERASDDALGYSVQRDSILVHLRFPILAPDADRESLPER
jgi:hypothetical protein